MSYADTNETDSMGLVNSTTICPRCITPFRVHPEFEGSCAICRRCRSTFTVGISRPAADDGEASILQLEVCANSEFLGEGCQVYASNLINALNLSEQAVSIATAAKFIATLPRHPGEFSGEQWQKSYAVQTLCFAEMKNGAEKIDGLWDFFFRRLPQLDDSVRAMTEASVMGVLRGVGVGLLRPAAHADSTPKPRRRWWFF